MKTQKIYSLTCRAARVISLALVLLAQQANAADGWTAEVHLDYRYFRDEAANSQSTLVTASGVPLTAQQIQVVQNFYMFLVNAGVPIVSLPAITTLTTTSAAPVTTDPSLVLQAQYQTQIDANTQFTFKPFFRYDGMDHYRTHYDIQELLWDRKFTAGKNPWELRIGYDKVFWGVAESNHLVDVINQTDTIENIDRTAKLGQPMVRLTAAQSWGTLDFFLLPYFNEPTFAGPDGRLRPPIPLTELPIRYESGAAKYHTDAALRWSKNFGKADVGIYYFKGTDRDARTSQDSSVISPTNPLGLVLNFDQMRQVGFDASYLLGNWTLKNEVIYRYTRFEDFRAAVYGLEYAFTGIFGTATDVNLFLEKNYDSRGSNSIAILQNDTFFGARFSLNDAQSTQFKLGWMQDLSYASRSIRLEASRRLTDKFTLRLESQIFKNISTSDPLYSLHADSYLQLSLQGYF